VRLPPEIEAAGYRLIAVTATQSTNDDAAAAARAADPGRLWVVAGEQRAGRGRHGRSWASPPGNLYASLLLIEPCPAAAAPQLGFLAGLALHDAAVVATGLGPPRLALKWPNDLLLDGAKAAGVLLEGHRLRSGAFAIVAGFGVNVAAAPRETPYPAAALGSLDQNLTAAALFEYLAVAFDRRFEAWRNERASGTADPFEAVRRQWLARAAGLGSTVTVRLAGGERSGAFAGLDSAGRLRLKTPAGLELIDAGDVAFPRLGGASAGAGRTS
jgi:BirA family biotin operon repressor/biotin-[acetyl-CoA-carboxylase] ligase